MGRQVSSAQNERPRLWPVARRKTTNEHVRNGFRSGLSIALREDQRKGEVTYKMVYNVVYANEQMFLLHMLIRMGKNVTIAYKLVRIVFRTLEKMCNIQ